MGRHDVHEVSDGLRCVSLPADMNMNSRHSGVITFHSGFPQCSYNPLQKFHIDHYGRTVPKGAHGSTKLDNPTNLGSQLIQAAVSLFDQIADKTLTVRRITIAANRVVKDEGIFQVDLFTDTKKLEKEKQLQEVMLGIKKKFGRNAVLKGTALTVSLRIVWSVSFLRKVSADALQARAVRQAVTMVLAKTGKSLFA